MVSLTHPVTKRPRVRGQGDRGSSSTPTHSLTPRGTNPCLTPTVTQIRSVQAYRVTVSHGSVSTTTSHRGPGDPRPLLSPLPTCRTELRGDPVLAPKAQAIATTARLEPLESDGTQPPRARKERTGPPEDTKGTPANARGVHWEM